MRISLIAILLITHNCFAQFDISKLPEITFENIQVIKDSVDINTIAEILIDNQFLGLDGKNIEKLHFMHKRLLRIKIYNSEAFLKSGFFIEGLNQSKKINLIHFKQGVKDQFHGVIGLIEKKIKISEPATFDFNEIELMDGNIIDIYLERNSDQLKLDKNISWNLSALFKTNLAYHEIEYPKVCKFDFVNNYPDINYIESEGNEMKLLNRYSENIKYAVLNYKANLENIHPSKSNLSSIIFIGNDHPSVYRITKQKHGSISDEEIKMAYYEHDSSASAVILYDHGEFEESNFMFTRSIRVKILKKTGLSWGNWTFNTPDKSDIDVVVFNDEHGIIEKEVVPSSDIKRERVIGNYYIYKVFAPNVKVGSVIDIKYSHFGLPFEWRFQQLVPVIHSELKIQNSLYLKYKTSHFGFEPIETIDNGHWSASNVPAFQKEPYLNDYSNYITKFEIQITTFSYKSRYSQGYSSIHFGATWQKINDILEESTYFGSSMRSMAYLNEKAKELKKSNLPTKTKIDLAYQYILDNIKWDEYKSIYNSVEHRKNFLNNHSGNSADVNLSLVTLLNKSGIKTYPVVLSTRENGLLKPYNSAFSKLNYVVGYVKTDSLEMLLDATSEDLIPGVLSEKCLNGQGWLVDQEDSRWIDLTSKTKSSTKKFIKIKLNEDKFFEASINNSNSDYAYLNWIENIKKFDDGRTYQAFLKDEYPELDVLDYKIGKKDKAKLYSTEVITIDMSNKIDDLGDEYIIDPFLLTKFKQNTFKSDTRRYPVDLKYPTEESATIVFEVPKGFRPKNIPVPISLKGLDGALKFTLISQQNDSFVTMNYKIEVKKSIFTEVEYHYVKTFLSAISDKFNEPINLQKI